MRHDSGICDANLYNLHKDKYNSVIAECMAFAHDLGIME